MSQLTGDQLRDAVLQDGARLRFVEADKRNDRIEQLQGHRATLCAYLRMKTDAGDWHAVADAANDLREIDAEIRGIRLAV